MSLNGRSALITGGGRGIGAATAEALAGAGARVGVAARTRAEVEEVADRLRAGGHDAFAFRCDVSDSNDVHDMAPEALECYERCSVLDPSGFRWPYFRGILTRIGDQKRALAEFQRAAS